MKFLNKGAISRTDCEVIENIRYDAINGYEGGGMARLATRTRGSADVVAVALVITLGSTSLLSGGCSSWTAAGGSATTGGFPVTSAPSPASTPTRTTSSELPTGVGLTDLLLGQLFQTRYVASNEWPTIKFIDASGVLNYRIADFDGDGSGEILTFNLEPAGRDDGGREDVGNMNPVYAHMFEMSNGVATQVSSMRIAADVLAADSDCVDLFLVPGPTAGLQICSENLNYYDKFVNGSGWEVDCLSYSDQKLTSSFNYRFDGSDWGSDPAEVASARTLLAGAGIRISVEDIMSRPIVAADLNTELVASIQASMGPVSYEQVSQFNQNPKNELPPIWVKIVGPATNEPCSSITLPNEVDRNIVCGPIARTTFLPSFYSETASQTWNGFKSPSGNIACAFYDDSTILCKALILDVTYPPDPRNNGIDVPCNRGLWLGDQGAGVFCAGDVRIIDEIPKNSHVPVLRYGETSLSTDYPYPSMYDKEYTPKDPVACSSAEDGVTCWDTATHHGIKISRTVAIYW